MDRRLLWEDDSEEGEEVDDDMIATEGERKGRGEREENERKVGEREREREATTTRERSADCKSVEGRRCCVWEVKPTEWVLRAHTSVINVDDDDQC
jgi:hypothetical protein